MIRRRNAILLALGLLAPLALVDSPAGAIDQDLVASVTAGPPGTTITVSSASCTDPVDDNAYLMASLYVGTAPNQQIAAFGSGSTGSATLTVPDWVDPDQPAVIEASCELYSDNGNDGYLEYDPIAFDIEPGSGTPVQVRTFSRTELLAGQGLTVTGSCGPALADSLVFAVVGSGTDQTGESFETIAGQGIAQAGADGSFELPLFITNAFVGIGIEENGSELTALTDEEPMDVPAGDYTAFIYCGIDTADDSIQFLEPQLLVITGSAPTSDIDLLNTAGSTAVSLTGICEAGDVAGSIEAMSTEELANGFGEPIFDPSARGNRFQAARVASARAASVRTATRGPANLVRSPDGATRVIADGEVRDFDARPAADGTWQVGDDAGFREGVVIATALCGDPMADGFIYDPQGVTIEVVEPTTTVPVTVPVTVPAPANAIPGTPTYAG